MLKGGEKRGSEIDKVGIDEMGIDQMGRHQQKRVEVVTRARWPPRVPQTSGLRDSSGGSVPSCRFAKCVQRLPAGNTP